MRGGLGLLVVSLLSLRAGASTCTEQTVELDFYTSCVQGVNHSNLGGAGPDAGPEELRFSRIGNLNGVPIDLSMRVLNSTADAYAISSAWNFTYTDPAYTPANAARNGCDGKFGQVNVMMGNSVTIDMQFRNHYTDALMVLPGFTFSFFDIDASAAANEVSCALL